MSPEKLGDGILPELSLGDSQHGLKEGFVRYVHFESIERQKDQGCHDPHSLVGIHEGMILDNVEEVSGRHFE